MLAPDRNIRLNESVVYHISFAFCSMWSQIVTLPEADFMLQAHELRLEQFNSSTGLEVSHDTAHLSLKNHSSAPDRPLLDSHYPSRGQYTPGDAVGEILEVVLISLAKVHMDLLSNYSARFVDEQDTLHLSVSIGLIFSTTILIPLPVFLLSTSAMEPFRQVPQSFDPLHSSS